MTRDELSRALECWSNGARQCNNDCPYRPSMERMNVVGVCDIPQLCKDALELLKAQQWVSVKDRLPEVVDSYIVAGKQRCPGEPWEYFTDIAESHGSYIDDFWDTFNDWVEGQDTHITHWMPLPEPPKEGDVP